MKPVLKAPGPKHLKLKSDEVLSSFAFNFIVCRYNQDNWRSNCLAHYSDSLVGRSKLKPVETRVQRLVSDPET